MAKYHYGIARNEDVPLGWYVKEVHEPSETARIVCYCFTDSVAKHISDSLNFEDAYPVLVASHMKETP